MPRFIIERNMPGVGDLSAEQLREASQTSRRVLKELGTDVQWEHSYVSDDRITCVYIATNEALVLEHARRSGFPADRILEVRTVIDPTTAEMSAVTA
jgi:hypothetical protein